MVRACPQDGRRRRDRGRARPGVDGQPRTRLRRARHGARRCTPRSASVDARGGAAARPGPHRRRAPPGRRRVPARRRRRARCGCARRSRSGAGSGFSGAMRVGGLVGGGAPSGPGRRARRPATAPAMLRAGRPSWRATPTTSPRRCYGGVVRHGGRPRRAGAARRSTRRSWRGCPAHDDVDRSGHAARCRDRCRSPTPCSTSGATALLVAALRRRRRRRAARRRPSRSAAPGPAARRAGPSRGRRWRPGSTPARGAAGCRAAGRRSPACAPRPTPTRSAAALPADGHAKLLRIATEGADGRAADRS